MADFIVSVRNLRRGDFGSEPGPTRFLKVPGNRRPKPDHAIGRKRWVDEVMAAGHTYQDAHTGEDCGDIVVFGPERLDQDIAGLVPETDRPVMAVIVPIIDDENQVAAAMLVRGFNMYDEFNRLFVGVALAGELDA